MNTTRLLIAVDFHLVIYIQHDIKYIKDLGELRSILITRKSLMQQLDGILQYAN